MFTIILQEKGGEQRRMVFNKPEVTIGRVQGNDIVLPKGNVSKRHARIVLKDGKFIIVDLKSTNGTYVNGRKITSPLVVKDSDKIYIGDFIVGVDEAASGEGDGVSETTTSPPGGDRLQSMPDRPGRGQPTEAVSMPMPMPVPEPVAPPPPVSQQTLRPNPPRPPGPSRDLPPPREPGAPSAPPPMGGAPIPPIGPGPSELRTRPPLGRPGGTMPPPQQPQIPMPAPIPPAPAQTQMEPPAPMPMPMPMRQREREPEPPAPMPQMQPAPIPAPMPAPRPMPAPMASPQMQPAPMNGAANELERPAPVVPIANKSRAPAAAGLAGVGARKTIGRSVAMPSRRGVHLEPLDPKIVKMLDLQSNILERLRTKLDLDKIPMDRLHEEDLWQRVERATIDLVETLETSGELPKYIDQDTLIKETLNEALALGPLEELLADEKIDEIVIDRRDRVVVGKEGVLRGSGKAFSSDDVFERVVKRLVAEAGAKIDDANPLVDLRMRDGTRLTAAVSPVAARGACLVLKKSPSVMPQLADLVGQGSMSNGMADFLATCVAARRNILVCGGPSSGKTTIVGAIASASPGGERVVSIEEVAELAIGRDEWVQLETRAGNGRNQVIDLAHLLETALRLMPDRLIIGEIRGREALPLISALDASVDGAVAGMTGEGANAALGRIATLCRAMGTGAPGSDLALREMVAQAFEIVIHVVRWADGSVRVAAIEEVVGCSDTAFETHVLFEQKESGGFAATGTVPRFYAELAARGIPADQAVFRN